jgi:hypothetical protein
MKNWIDFYRCLIHWHNRFFLVLFLLLGLESVAVMAQAHRLEFQDINKVGTAGYGTPVVNNVSRFEAVRDTVPEPGKVMRRSAILPGWGQITNQQAWKVPVVYGVIAGAVVYTMYNDRMYQGFRAAYYNSFPANTDLRFGPTPAFVPSAQPPEIYRFNRNQFRNRRDLAVLGVVLAYGLNIADAYIFAQLRDFDVSDDLSATMDVTTESVAGIHQPLFTITLRF